MDYIYNRRKKDEFYKVFHAFNNCHENIELIIEISRSKFLHTQLINVDGTYIAKFHRKERKIAIHWPLKIPKRYKRNTITTELHQAVKIASNMKEEIQTIRKKFIKTDYPRLFVNSLINQYNNKTKE